MFNMTNKKRRIFSTIIILFVVAAMLGTTLMAFFV